MNAETKRHIDAARQVLVGVVPNPASQIDQITNALIYKFMDDMDQSAIKQGGESSFFTGDIKDYAWTRLMDTRIGNQERMNIYSEALVKFSESKQLPQLFREIFKSAFLPYRSPEVLGLFLKEIDYFDYSHPEELGNAYEYLLSIMSSQGDAGQFRTPRHIIDFIVDIINPTVEDKVLDPACGTGGFLVSAYKHIAEQHDGKNPDGTKNKEKPLTPDQRKNLMSNFEGYDIDPGMVRIAQVNMYLHQFKNPKIYNYDSLSMEERWNDKFDVILANPPFMSPKGGVSTHNKFSINATRSEVLFVDYIMNHLRPKGRAGIIVPEGIIFQSGSSHKQLRKNLVNDGLYAVVSLPAGVFQPYSGVKTSILLFNNGPAKQSKEILFVKVENDGFDLGAQRRPSTKNDLPKVLEILNKWNAGVKIESAKAIYVEKAKIAESEDYNLSGDRYGVAVDYTNVKWSIVKLGDVCDFIGGFAFKSEELEKEKKAQNYYPVIKIGNVDKSGVLDISDANYSKYEDFLKKFLISKDDILIAMTGATVGKVACSQFDNLLLNQRVGLVKASEYKVLKSFLKNILLSEKFYQYCQLQAGGGAQGNISPAQIQKYSFPLPPLEIQEQIVAELDGYQNIITGAKQITSNWNPIVDVDPEWEKTTIGEVSKLLTGGTPLTTRKDYYGGDIKWLVSGDINKGEIFDCEGRITDLALKESSAKLLPIDSVLIALNGQGKTRATVAILRTVATCNQSLVAINTDRSKLVPEFLLYLLKGKYQEIRNINGDNQRGGLNMPIIRSIQIPLPPLDIQKQIVERIEAECILVEGNKKLIEIYEQKIKDVLARLWED